jgi:hypothetical protein
MAREHVLSAEQLVADLDATFRIVESCLDRWTLDMLEEEVRRPEFGPDWVHRRGSVIQRVFSHDVWHAAQLNEILAGAGRPQIAFGTEPPWIERCGVAATHTP